MVSFASVTIVAHNYLPQARILAESFREHHPSDDFYIVVIDRPTGVHAISEDGVTVLSIQDVDMGDEGYLHMAAIYDVTEFATSVKPFVLRHLLGSHDCVFYLDPDIKLFASLQPLVEMTVEFGWSLTPHVTSPIVRNGAQPTEQEIKAAGIYNLGYVGVTKRSRALLDWWSERLRRDSVVDVANQLFTDQRWIDMAAALFPAYVERSTAYNVAYWNLDQRHLWRQGDVYMVNDEPLRFFHFSGYDPDDPHWISKYQTGRPRVLLSDSEHVAGLCEEYGSELLAIRDEIVGAGPYGWRDVVPGLRWTRSLRRCLRQEILDAESRGEDLPPSPYRPGDSGRFLEWLQDVSPHDPTRLPRHVAAAYRDRGDLQAHFPEVATGDISRFGSWLETRGPVEIDSIRLLGVTLPPGPVGTTVPRSTSRKSAGIDVIGYLNAEVGIGEAGRLLSQALSSVGVPTTAIHYSRTLSRQSLDFARDSDARFRTLMMAANADQVPVIARDLGEDFLRGRYVISQWFWELESLPPWYPAAYEVVDEVWAPSMFIRDAMAGTAPDWVSLRHMQLPLVAPRTDPSVGRSTFGLDDGFTFLFTFDFFSVFKRKNPLGIIDAFCRAFGPDDGARLVIKSINGQSRIRELEALRWAMRKRPDIILMDEYLPAPVAASLTAASDCYVSLHRSEGLGLTMAEAMLLGVPVIATAYGGNMDFMSGETALLVPWERTAVGTGAEAYAADATWAEPDLEVAASYMRQLFENPEQAARMGSRAREDLSARFTPEVCGGRMKQRLEEIWGGRTL